ncbi:hypothetical protein VD0004_g2831 [Verticillium dahliae]|nr:hypothetical protein VD0004_g2831 [Verticillium dahliae]PNH72924.1 hypothetical protein VD0001_g4654 [Verticillium dahliae]
MEPQDEVQYCPYRTSAGYGEVNTADYSNVRYYEFSESENDNQQNYEDEGPHGPRATQQPPPTLTSSSKKAKKKSKKARAPSPLPSPPNDAPAPTQDIVDPDEEWGSQPKSKKKSKKTQQTPAPALPVEEPTAPEPTTIDAEEEPVSTTKSKKKKDKKKSKAGKDKDSDAVEEKVVIAPPAAEAPDEQVVEEEISAPKTKAQKAKDKKEKKDKKKDKKKSKGKNDDAEHEADIADKSLSAPAAEPSSLSDVPDTETTPEVAEPSPSASPTGDDDAKAAEDEPPASPAGDDDAKAAEDEPPATTEVKEEAVADAPVLDEAPSHPPSVSGNETVEADKEPSVDEAANDEATAAPEKSSAVDDKAASGASETLAPVAVAVSEEPAPPAEAALAQEQEPSSEALVVEEAKNDDPAAPADDHSNPKPSEELAAPELVVEVASNDTAPPTVEAGTEPNTEPAVEPALESAVEPAPEAAAEPPAEPPTETPAEPATTSAAEPAVESAAEPALELATEPAAEPTAEAAVEPASESSSEPAVEPAVEPAPEPADKSPAASAEPAVEPASNSAAEPAPEAAAEPPAEPAAGPATASAVEPASESIAEPAPESAEPAVEPASESIAEPAVELSPEPAAKSPAEPAAEPTLETASESITEPAVEPAPKAAAEAAEPAIEPVSASVAEPAVELSPEPPAEPTAEPTAEPASESAAGSAVELAPEPDAAPAVIPAAETAVDSAPESTAEPASGPAAESTVDPAVVPAAEPASESATEPAAEPPAESAVESSLEPAEEPAAKLAVDPNDDTVIEPDAESASEPNAELVVESSTEPTAEPATEPAAGPAVESANEPATDPAVGSAPEPALENVTEAVVKPAETQAESSAEHVTESTDVPAIESSTEEIATEPPVTSLTELASEPASEITTESAAEVVTESSKDTIESSKDTIEPTAAPTAEPSTEPTAEPATESAVEPSPETAPEAAAESAVEPSTSCSTEDTPETVTENTIEPTSEATHVPATELVAGTPAGPSVESSAEPDDKPATESTAKGPDGEDTLDPVGKQVAPDASAEGVQTASKQTSDPEDEANDELDAPEADASSPPLADISSAEPVPTELEGNNDSVTAPNEDKPIKDVQHATSEEAAVLVSEAIPSDIASPTKSDETATAAGDEQSTEAATSSDGTPVELKQQAGDGEPAQVPPAALASEPLPDDNLADEDTLVQSPDANMSGVAEIGLSGQMTEQPDEGVLEKTLEAPPEVAEQVPADKGQPDLGASSAQTDTDTGEVRSTSTTKADALDGQITEIQENPADQESVTADETQPIELAGVAPDVSSPEESKSELEPSENPAAVVAEAPLADKASLTDDTTPSKDVGDSQVVETPAASRDEVEKDCQSTEQGNKIEEIATPLTIESQAQDLVPAMNNDISDEDLALYGITSDSKQLSCTESILAQNAETTLAALTSESTKSTEADLEPEIVEPVAGAAETSDRGDETSRSKETTSEPQSVSVTATGIAPTDVMVDTGVTANTTATAEGDSESPPIPATNLDVPVQENPSLDAPAIVEEAASVEAKSAASHADAAPEIASEPAEEDPEPTTSVLEPGPVDKPDEVPDSDTKAELGKGEKTADPDTPESSALVEESVPPETSSAEATTKTTEVDPAADSELSKEETTAILDSKDSIEPLEVGLEPVPDLACTEQPASRSQATELEDSSAETKPEVEDEENATKESGPDSKVVGEPRPDVVEEHEIIPSNEPGSELSECELKLANEESAAVAISQPTKAAGSSQASTENTPIDIPEESEVTLSTGDEPEQSKQPETETTTQVLGADTSSEEPEAEGIEPGEPEAPTTMSEVVSETPDVADEPKPKTSIEELDESGLSKEITPESVEGTEPGPLKSDITTSEPAEASGKEPPAETPIAVSDLEAKELANEPTATDGQATSPAEASGDVEPEKPSDDQAEPESVEAAPAVVEQGSEPATTHPSSEPEVSSSDDLKVADAPTIDLVPEGALTEVPQPNNEAESTSNDTAQEPDVVVEPPEPAVEDEKPASEPEAQTAAPHESEDVQAIEEEPSSQGDSSAQPKAEVVEEDSTKTPKDAEAATQEDKPATEVTEDAPKPGVPPKEPDNGEPIDTASAPDDAAHVTEPEVSTAVLPQETEEPTGNTGGVEPPGGAVPSPEAAAPQEESSKEPQVGETADPTDAAPPTPPPEVDEDKKAEAEEGKDSVGPIIGSEQTKSQPKTGETHLHFLDHDAPDGSVRDVVEGPASGINGEDVRDGIAHNLSTPAAGNVSGQGAPECVAGQEMAVIPALDTAVGESDVVIGRVGHVETNTLGDEQPFSVLAAAPEASESFPGESVDLPQTPIGPDSSYEVDCTTTDLATDGPKGSTNASQREEPDIVTTTVDDGKLDLLQDGDQPLAESVLASDKEQPSDQLCSQGQTSTGAGPDSDVSTETTAEEVAMSTAQLSGSPIPVARGDTIAIEDIVAKDIETEQDASSSMGWESGLQRSGESATEIYPSEEPAPKFATLTEEDDHAHSDDAESVEGHHQSLVDEETLANTGDETQWPASDLADTLAVAPSSVGEPMIDVSSTLKAAEENRPSLVNEDLPISEAGLLSEPVVSVVDDAQSPRNPKEHILVLPTDTEDDMDAAARLEDINVPEEINKNGEAERHTYPEVEALPDDSGSLEQPLREPKQMTGDVDISSVFHNTATAAVVTAGAAGLVASAPVFCDDQPSREQTLETSSIAHRASSDKLTQTLFDQPMSMSGESFERQNVDEVVDMTASALKLPSEPENCHASQSPGKPDNLILCDEGTQTDDSFLNSQLRPLTPRLDAPSRAATPAIVLPDATEPTPPISPSGRQWERIRRRERKQSIARAEEMVAAAVVLYATAEVLSPPSSPTLGSSKPNPRHNLQSIEHQMLDDPISDKDSLTRIEASASDLGKEEELQKSVADLFADVADDNKEADSSHDRERRRRHRVSHHSSHQSSHHSSRSRPEDSSKDGSSRRHSHHSSSSHRRHRTDAEREHDRQRDRERSSRSTADADPQTPPRTPQRQDSGFSAESPQTTGSARRRHRSERTPEEQAAHERRKEERRARERAEEEQAARERRREDRRAHEHAQEDQAARDHRREERRERTPEEQAAHERRKEERRAARERERELERGEERRREKEKERSRSSAVKESKGKEPEIDASSPAERAHHHRRVRRHSTSVSKDEGPASAPATVSNKKFFDMKNAEGGVGLGFQSPSSHAKPATPEQAPTVTFEEASPSSREVPKRSSTTRSRHGHGHRSRTEDLSKLARARDAVAEEAREAKEAKEAREARRAARRAREETAASEEGSSTKGEDSRRRAREEERKRTRDRDIEKEKEREKNGFRAAFKRLFTS